MRASGEDYPFLEAFIFYPWDKAKLSIGEASER
jgi:hypothetical protein